MSDYVFEINPDQYLYKANDEKCYFVIHKCRLPGKNKNLFLIGDAFLRHFYSVYNFDQDQISLGVNTHSKGLVNMYKPGERPKDAAKAETQEDNMSQATTTEEKSADSNPDLDAPTKTQTSDDSLTSTSVQSSTETEQKTETKTDATQKETTKTKEKSESKSDMSMAIDNQEPSDIPTDIDDVGLKSKIAKNLK